MSGLSPAETFRASTARPVEEEGRDEPPNRSDGRVVSWRIIRDRPGGDIPATAATTYLGGGRQRELRRGPRSVAGGVRSAFRASRWLP